ncbi:MAG: hypothetical protein KKC18_09035, partial [Chloroflexi bacterium]|nr:hypothetical protein [Chloroflexota bacterium]
MTDKHLSAHQLMFCEEDSMIEQSEYRQVLHLYGQVINSLEGFRPSDQRLVEAQSLALKLFEHAAA